MRFLRIGLEPKDEVAGATLVSITNPTSYEYANEDIGERKAFP